MIPLPQDFSEFLQSLNDQQVRYLLIGGYAVAYHGYPRSTADMDVWTAMEPANVLRGDYARFHQMCNEAFLVSAALTNWSFLGPSWW